MNALILVSLGFAAGMLVAAVFSVVGARKRPKRRNTSEQTALRDVIAACDRHEFPSRIRRIAERGLYPDAFEPLGEVVIVPEKIHG